MPEFNTRQAQDRWNNLGKGDQATIDKIMRGQGTMQDFRKIQSLLGRYDRLASKIFNQAVEALGAVAKARVDSVAQRREERCKCLDEEQLASLLETATRKAWDDAGPELVVIIEESIQSQLLKQDERLGTMFSEKLQETFAPARADWELQLQALQAQGEARAEEKRWDDRVDDLKQWLAQELRQFEDLEHRVGAAARDQVKEVLDAWGTHGFSNPQTEAEGVTNPGAAPGSKKDPITSRNYTSETLGKISDSLDELATETSDDQDREQKRANIWWRSLKAMGGFAAGMAKGAKSMFGSSFFGSMATLVGGLLVTELLGGKLLSKIGEFLSSGKIIEWGGTFLKFVSDNAKKLTDWIVAQFTSARESRDKAAGVDATDSQELKNAKIDLLKMRGRLEHGSQYWGNTPEDHDKLVNEAKTEIANQEKKVEALEKAKAEEKAASSGKIGSPDQTSSVGGAPAQTPVMSGGGLPSPDVTSSTPSAPPPDQTSMVAPLASRGAQPVVPGLGTGTADLRQGDPATSMYTVGETPVYNVGKPITSAAAPANSPQQVAAAGNSAGSNTAVNLSGFRRTPGDDMLTVMNLGMYTA